MSNKKCIALGCKNHENEGGFVGDLCSPCYNMITTGEHQRWLHRLTGEHQPSTAHFAKCMDFLYYVCSDYYELSHEKVQWQRDDWRKMARKIQAEGSKMEIEND